MFYGGYQYQLSKDTMEQVRTEIERDRLAKGSRREGAGEARTSVVARGTALVAALLR